MGDVGHTLIIGPTGSGKSTLLGMLALGWIKYPGAQVIVFDKDRSAPQAWTTTTGRPDVTMAVRISPAYRLQ